MSAAAKSTLVEVFDRHEKDLLSTWMELQLRSASSRRDLINDAELREQSSQFLRLVREAATGGGIDNLESPAWAPVRELLSTVSQARARLGFTPSETATFVLSLKEPVFSRLGQELRGDAGALADEVWRATVLFDSLALITTEAHQKTRERLIAEQQREMLELSTPVVQLWDGVLGLPLIGTLDSARTQVVMENLLQEIVREGAAIAIIDITGVPTVDTLVAQHLLKTVAAARLMGADCIISGIRPQIAQTIVHLGLDLTTVATKATLADAFALALQRVGLGVTRVARS